jgi:uncharacterized protein YndB with AHSA1/START domain
MAIEHDGSGTRWVEMAVVVPGTAEQVWRAMATGPGNTAWFTATTIDERVGGAIRFDFGPNGTGAGEVTTWEPPHRFGYVERDWAEDAPPVATDVTIAARGDGRCVVRLAHSIRTTADDWDDHLEGFEGGWPAFFAMLRLYLAHFADLPAATFIVGTVVEAPQLDVWTRLTGALGLAGANAGEERTTPDVPEALTGVVERVEQDAAHRYLLLRLHAPTPGLALVATYGAGEATRVNVSLYPYGDDAARRAAAGEPRWREWLGATMT